MAVGLHTFPRLSRDCHPTCNISALRLGPRVSPPGIHQRPQHDLATGRGQGRDGIKRAGDNDAALNVVTMAQNDDYEAQPSCSNETGDDCWMPCWNPVAPVGFVEQNRYASGRMLAPPPVINTD